MLTEEWRPVVGYEGFYEVSDQGRVKSLSRHVHHAVYGSMKVNERFLEQTTDDKGYYVVTLYGKKKIKKTIQVHKIVAYAFLGKRKSHEVIRHGIEGKKSNKLSNLSYGTHLQNMKDKVRDGTQLRGEAAPNAKLLDADIATIRQMYAEGVYQKDIAKHFKVSQSLISRIVNKTRRIYN